MKNNTVILVIDDNPDDIFIVKRAIMKSRSGCTVETAADAVQAQERLGRPDLPGLILLDLKMPGMGGIEVLRFIRAGAQTRYIPVVMITSSKMESDQKAAYEAGANGFLHKEHDLTQFTESIRSTLHYWIDINLSPS